MTRMPSSPIADQDAVFESVAELFSLLSTPVRLKIISALCNGEKNVSQLLAEIETTQPNMSQHLATVCRAVCTQVAIDLDPDAEVPASERLLPSNGR